MKQLLFFLLGVFSGALVLYFLLNLSENFEKKIPNFSESIQYSTFSNKQSQHTKNILYIEEEVESQKYSDIKKEIQNYLLENNYEDKASIYYFNLENNSWFGIREKQPIIPASLTKILLAFSVYKAAEINPNLLSEKITYNNEFSERKNILTQFRLQSGKEYSYEEIVKQMLFYSDNEAFFLLHKKISQEYTDILLETEKIFQLDFVNLIDLKTYSGLFKSLYYASYLSANDSEKLLQQLINQDFKLGIVTPLAEQEIEVAHKFGYFEPTSQISGTKTFVQCGIVYTENEYLLCVSIRSQNNTDEEVKDSELAAEAISKKVYDFVKDQ